MVAQKILSCVARVGERFGVGQVMAVLRGENTADVRRRGHDHLSTFGLLREHAKADVRQWIYQLVGQKVLLLDGEEYPILRLNEASWEVMKGQKSVRLLQPVRREEVKEPKAASVSWEGVDSGLFEVLRGVRGKTGHPARRPRVYCLRRRHPPGIGTRAAVIAGKNATDLRRR